MAKQFSEIIKEGGGVVDLGLAYPTGIGYAASIGAEGKSNTTPPTFWKKTGSGDTDWAQVLTTSSFGSPVGSGILSFDESGNMVLISEINGGTL